jgi:LPXTG-motif cell wall-anchored protein
VTSGSATVLVEAPGFLPLSFVVVTLFSTPIVLGVFQVDEQGRLLMDVTLPPDLPPGQHDIVVSGLGVKGGAWQYVQPVNVLPAVILPPPPEPSTGSTTQPSTVPATTRPSTPAVVPGGSLPPTGGGTGSDALGLVGAAVLGAGLLLGRCRRRPEGSVSSRG